METVKIISIHRHDAHFHDSEKYIGRFGEFNENRPCEEFRGYYRGWFFPRAKRLLKAYFYAVKVAKITRKKKDRG